MLPLFRMMMIQLLGHSMNDKYQHNACAVVFIHGSSRGLAGFQACFIDSTGKSYGNIQVDLV